MLGRIAGYLPLWAYDALRRARTEMRALPYRGQGLFCPVCEREARAFVSYGRTPRPNARCPHCLALERHRLAWLYWTTRSDLFDGRPKRVLHIAPEAAFRPRLARRLGDGYLTADLAAPHVMERMDVTRIQHAPESFDVILCSHVLEHVPDDRRAMAELHRVLKRGGWALIQVPVISDVTFEDPSIVDPAERLRVYGQEDHVRRYGPDVAGRLRDAGFRVDVVYPADLASPAEIQRMALTGAVGELFICTKP